MGKMIQSWAIILMQVNIWKLEPVCTECSTTQPEALISQLLKFFFHVHVLYVQLG